MTKKDFLRKLSVQELHSVAADIACNTGNSINACRGCSKTYVPHSRCTLWSQQGLAEYIYARVTKTECMDTPLWETYADYEEEQKNEN